MFELNAVGILVLVASFAIGILLGAFLRKRTAEKKIGSAELEAINIIKKATESGETRKKELLLEAKEESIKIKNEYEKENRERKNELSKAEKRLIQREESLDKKFNSIENRENQLQKKNDELDLQKQNLEEAENKQIKLLEQISGFSQEQAKEYLLETVKEDVRIETAVIIKDATARAKAEADKKVLDILSGAIQRCAVDHVSESTVSVVHLPSDEMKGRIIGREGRNIRTLESLTGIDLIIDDTPEAVILSGFDAVRREIARLTLEKLILDGRIHPARIEEMVEKSKKEVETLIKEEGESAIFEIGIRSIHPELIKLLGKMKFRTSYGQNVLKHSIEVAHLSGLIASELGVDVTLAKRAGLLHDIGKSVDQDMEGTHVQIGANLCKKYRENDIIINAVESHHGDVEPTNIISVIVQIADAISAARPGARRETLETYIKRLEKLEAIADAYKGVEKSFAIQAGRELRVLIIPEEVDDAAMTILARDISKSIESELEYPGQIKVSLIRETRAIEYAK